MHFAAATAPSPRTRPQRPITGAGAATNAASSTSCLPRTWTARTSAVFADDEPLDNPVNEDRFPAWLGWAWTSPSNAWATWTSAGSRCTLAVQRQDRAGTPVLRRLHDQLASVAPGASVRPAAPLEPRGPRPHAGPLCTRRSPGPRFSDAVGGLWGLGVEGHASVRRLRTMGCVPVLVDDAPVAPRVDGLDVLTTGSGGLEALLRCEVVVKSPGISRYRPEVAHLESAGVASAEDWDCSWRRPTAHGSPDHRDQGQEHNHCAGRPPHHRPRLPARRRREHRRSLPWDPSPEPDPDYRVIEISSFQAPDLVAAPHVVAVTSLAPDHLDWHGSVERYYADKLSLCTKPGVSLALADGSDDQLRVHAALIGPHLRWVTAADVERDIVWSASLGLPGPHNAAQRISGPSRSVGMGSRAPPTTTESGSPHAASADCPVGATPWAASRASSSSTTACRRTCCRHRRPCSPSSSGPSRCWWAGTTVGSTTPHWAGPLRTAPPRRSSSPCRTTVRGIGAAVRAAGDSTAEVIDAVSLDAAVEAAFAWAGSGAVVLLSPAAPSFGRYGDYRERSAAFAAAAGRCGQLS